MRLSGVCTRQTVLLQGQPRWLGGGFAGYYGATQQRAQNQALTAETALYVLTEYIVRGVQAGSIYGLLALPMSLLFATAGTIDFAVGAYALLAAHVATIRAGPL